MRETLQVQTNLPRGPQLRKQSKYSDTGQLVWSMQFNSTFVASSNPANVEVYSIQHTYM